MAAQVLFNPLPYIDRLTREGVSQDLARAHAEALETAFAESVATKRDLTDVKNELQKEIAEVKHELKQDIASVKNDVLRWMFAFNLAMLGAIFAMLKFLH